MTTNTIIQMRPAQPGDEIIYVQTPQTDVIQPVQEEDSWDLAEEKAKQAQDAATAGADDESSSSAIISTHSADSSSDLSSDSDAINSSSSSSSSAPATAATASTPGTARTTSAAVRGAHRMNTAVPASADFRVWVRANVRPYHFCAFATTLLLTAGTVFTLMAKQIIPHRDSGYVYPEEIEFDKVLAGLWYGAGAITGGIGVANAVHHYRRDNN